MKSYIFVHAAGSALPVYTISWYSSWLVTEAEPGNFRLSSFSVFLCCVTMCLRIESL